MATEHDVQTLEDTVPTGEFSEAELEGLSDEERAALAEDEPEATEPEPEEAAHVDQEEATAEASDEGAEPQDSEAAEEAEAEPEAQAAEAEEVGEENPDPNELMKDPGREVGDVQSLDGKIAEISKAIAELDAQVADGEIDLTDHIKQTRELQDAKTALMLEKANYQRNAQENQREVQIAWDMAIDSFYSDPSNKKYDSPDNGGNPVIFEAMSNWVSKLQEQQPGRKPSWYLQQAKKDVDAAFGIAVADDPAKPAPKQRRKSALDNADIPRTLADTPSAANNSVESEFSHLDKLDGLDLEAAVAALTPAQMERWARQ